MRGVHEPPVQEIDLEEWVRVLLARYPHCVHQVWLCGSRASGAVTGPDHDYDLLIVLREECYDQEGKAKDQLEQRIAFDPRVRFEGLDLFFWRQPHGYLGRWEWGPGEPPAWVMQEEDEEFRAYLLDGVPFGDFNRFYRDLKYARRLYSQASPCP
jgi:predicted nucleotidyltransferase